MEELLGYSGREGEEGKQRRKNQKILYIMSINYLAGPATGDRRTRQINYTPLGSA